MASNTRHSFAVLAPEIVGEIFQYLYLDTTALKNASLVCKAWEWPAKSELFFRKTADLEDIDLERLDNVAFRLGKVIRHLKLRNPDTTTFADCDDTTITDGKPHVFDKALFYLERSLRTLPVLREITFEATWLMEVEHDACYALLASIIKLSAARKRVSDRSTKISRWNVCAEDFKQIDDICDMVEGDSLGDFITCLRTLNIHTVERSDHVLIPAYREERPERWEEGEVRLFSSLCNMDLNSITTLKLRFHYYEKSLCHTNVPEFKNLRHLKLEGLEPEAAKLLSSMITPSCATLATIRLTNILLYGAGTFATLFEGIMKCENLTAFKISCCAYRLEAGLTPDAYFVLQEQPWWDMVISSDLNDLHAFRDLIHKVSPVQAANWANSTTDWTDRLNQVTPEANERSQAEWVSKLASLETYQRSKVGCCWDDQRFGRSMMGMYYLVQAYPFHRPHTWGNAPYTSSYGHGGLCSSEPGLRTIVPRSAENAARVAAAAVGDKVVVRENGGLFLTIKKE